MRALIVDDSRFVRGYLCGLLKESGFDCAEAGNGQDAFRILKASLPFDIALVDWNMPVMNGLEFVKQMRAAGFVEAKVLMVTTEAENDFIVRALDAGADEYLMKPFDGEALNEKLAMLGLAEDPAPYLANDVTEA